MGARTCACVCADARSTPLLHPVDTTSQHSAHTQHPRQTASVSLCHLYSVEVYPDRRVRVLNGEFYQREGPDGWDVRGLDVPRHVQPVLSLYVLRLAVSNNSFFVSSSDTSLKSTFPLRCNHC